MYESFFSKRLAELRIQKGISARDMSLSLGQSESYINKIENGKSLPSMTVFFYICEFFQISPSEFFDENNKTPMLYNELIEAAKNIDDKKLKLLIEFLK